MAYESVKNQIDAYIKANGVNLITGPVLNAVLTTMLDSLGEGYAFQGVLNTTDIPSPAADIPQAWLASAGTYLGGSITVDEGELALILHTADGWSKETVYRGLQLSHDAIVDALGYAPADEADLAEKQDTIADLSAIRSGAALGETSVQPVDIENMVEAEPIGSIIPPVNPSEFATKEELSQLGREINAIQNATIPGNNNTLSYKDIYNIKPGHTYRMYLKNPDYDVSGVTTTSGVYRMQIRNNDTTNLVSSQNFASALNDYYDFTVPSSSDFVRFAFRATLGVSVYIELVDMTALSEIILTNGNVKQSIANVLGLGVNLFNYNLASPTTTNGVTITKVNATQFRLNGTATGNINWLVSSKGYPIDASVAHKVKIECSNATIDGTKVHAYFGGFKSDNSQVQGTRVATNGGYVAINYDSSIVSSRVQFHIDSGQTFDNVLFTIYDVAGGDTLDELADSMTEMDAKIAAQNKGKRNGQITGNGNVYTSVEIYGLLPGQRYCINLDGWDLSGVTAGNVIFEVVNFVGSNFTRLILKTTLDVNNHYSFIVPNVSDFIRIGGRIATGKTALWEIVPDDSHLFGEVGQYQGAKISLNEYRMMRWFNLLDYGSLSLNMASQGFDIWGDYLFQAGTISGAATANNIAVVDLKNRTIAGQVEFTDTSYHMNNINCGVKYADADTYPLLYVSQTYGTHKCSVIRLANNLASYTTIQEISYSGSAHFANSNAYDWFIDLTNGYIYAFGNVAGSVTRLEILKFALPATSIAEVVFTDDDVLDSFFLDIPGVYQGSRMIGGKLFAPVGFGNAQYPAHLLVVDLDKKEIISDVNFGTSVGEIEGCAPYNDLLVINNVSTNPIYRTIKF